MTAFLEHYRALESLPARTPDEEGTLGAMKRLIGEIGADAAMAVAAPSQPESAAGRRHRGRAELGLRRELAARGVLMG